MGAPPSPYRFGGSGAARGGWSWTDSLPERSALPLPQLAVGTRREEEEKGGEREVDKVGPTSQPPSRWPHVNLSMLTWISEDVFGRLRFSSSENVFSQVHVLFFC